MNRKYALPKGTAEWTATVIALKDVTCFYNMVSAEIRQSRYFVSHVIELAD